MSISKAAKWAYRNTASSMLLVLLLGACALADFLARTRMYLANRKFAIMDVHTLRQMGLIDFIHAHTWIIFTYVAVFTAFLLWLELRAAPRWSVWATFIVLALPMVAYGSACLHISNKFILLTTAGGRSGGTEDYSHRLSLKPEARQTN